MADRAASAAAIPVPAANPFPNYLEMPSRVPKWFWHAMRIATLVVVGLLVWVIAAYPSTGFMLFWRLAIPLLPAMFAFAPGLWREVCPMAFLNQMPRTFGFGLNKTLPASWKNVVYIVSVMTFFALVSLRWVYFNINPLSLIALMSIALALAFVGGFVFKGRSGWCGTFCPLAPIQRAYGNAPVVVVKNGYCPTCVGCQKNCYDFNPKAAIHGDLSDPDPWYAGHKKFFIGALPGFAAGFYLVENPHIVGLFTYYVELAGAIMVSLGCFMALTGLVRISAYKAAVLFAMGALIIYYWFNAPFLIQTFANISGQTVPGESGDFTILGQSISVMAGRWAILTVIAALAGAVMYNGLRSEQAYAKIKSAQPKVGVKAATIRAAGATTGAGADSDLVVERSSGRSFAAEPDRSLLEGIESAGLKIDFGCRMGVCGADPVAIIDGMGNLSEPSKDELATLRRLGLEGRARMACVCRAPKGGVTIDIATDPRTLPEPPAAAPTVDLGIKAGIGKVVIIGNGAAGASAADEVRRASASCKIDVVAKEDRQFYNRMAIGRLVYGRTAMQGLYLLAPDWAEANKINVWLNTVVSSVDLAKREVRLGTGEKLPYDRLIMAQGGRAVMPPAPGIELPGCFVLREASDAVAIRRWRQEHDCKYAVVAGGGVLGVEAADALRHLNLDVTILERSPRLMNRQLDARGSSILMRFLDGLGVTVKTEVSVARINGTDRIKSITLSDGTEIPCDLYLAAAGVAPNIDLAKAAGLRVNRGVVVDASMRTSDPNVFAIGDVAELPGAIGGLWAVANAQAAVAVSAMFGGVSDYSAPSTLVSLKLEGIDVKGYGLTDPAGDKHEVIGNDEGDDSVHRKLILEDGKLVGAVFVGPPGTGKHIAAAINNRTPIGPVLDDLRHGKWERLAELV
jgi:NADPH-dependent 2,4-dienoyl-CoA reductase/sulfur reductase-like enzyme/ferredoxin